MRKNNGKKCLFIVLFFVAIKFKKVYPEIPNSNKIKPTEMCTVVFSPVCCRCITGCMFRRRLLNFTVYALEIMCLGMSVFILISLRQSVYLCVFDSSMKPKVNV